MLTTRQDRLDRMPAMTVDRERALRLAQETFEIEAAAVLGLKQRTGEAFARAVEKMLTVRGRVVVMGIGKSGHIARKIAATLASTGTPAMFVHPAAASHGDLVMSKPIVLVLAVSNSGEVVVLSTLLPVIKRLGSSLVAMTGNPNSTLARHADIVLDSGVEKEACPLQLAPTASTTAQLALGDALAVALLDARGFRQEDFARSHPGGALGRKLLTHVSDVMRTGDTLPRVSASTGFTDMMRIMSGKGLGASAVTDADGKVLGIFTDGDLRRLDERGTDMRGMTAGDVMHTRPKTIHPEALAAEAAQVMDQHRITLVLVVDAAGKLVGAVNSNDLLRAKVI